MNSWRVIVISLCLLLHFSSVFGAAIPGDVDEQGLYSKSDHVIILTYRNFDREIYNQKHGVLVEFYNSFCGHCRAFAPKLKSVAGQIKSWKNVMRLGVFDCSVDENNDICRDFEVLAYPSMRYFHPNYVKGNGNIGEKMETASTPEKLKSQILKKIQEEQSKGRLASAPPLSISSYSTFRAVLNSVPKDVQYTFVVFENGNSTVGSEIALDMNEYEHVAVRRVYDTSELAHAARIDNFPGVVVVDSNFDATPLTPKYPTKQNVFRGMLRFLSSKNYNFPVPDTLEQIVNIDNSDNSGNDVNTDGVYYSDLEKTIRTSLHTEITRYKNMTGEPLLALLDYLNILLSAFPFRGNMESYIRELYHTLTSKNEWTGKEISDLVKQLETVHAPVYTTNLEFIGCKGSQVIYRGYSCGLWTLFHTLTVNAAQKPGLEGPRVLRAMHGYVKNFFGCTGCVKHFQAMAAKNKIFDVRENDKAVLWLWISHNEVNLRLAGDETEDPKHPKIQFPSVPKCPACRHENGTWNLSAVYQYLLNIYSGRNLISNKSGRRAEMSAIASSSPFSNMDIGMLSLLYIFSFFILILAFKYFLSKRFYRKRFYKHGWGKV